MKCLYVLAGLLFCSCTNFEELRRDKFAPDHAVKNPTTFLESKSVNGRFLSTPLTKGEPLILLKRGLGYSAVQLYSGRIGEVPNQDIRSKEEGENFEKFYARSKAKNRLTSITSLGSNSVTNETSEGIKRIGNNNELSVAEDEEKFPILNNPFGSVEPDLPEW